MVDIDPYIICVDEETDKLYSKEDEAGKKRLSYLTYNYLGEWLLQDISCSCAAIGDLCQALNFKKNQPLNIGLISCYAGINTILDRYSYEFRPARLEEAMTALLDGSFRGNVSTEIGGVLYSVRPDDDLSKRYFGQLRDLGFIKDKADLPVVISGLRMDMPRSEQDPWLYIDKEKSEVYPAPALAKERYHARASNLDDFLEGRKSKDSTREIRVKSNPSGWQPFVIGNQNAITCAGKYVQNPNSRILMCI